MIPYALISGELGGRSMNSLKLSPSLQNGHKKLQYLEM